MRTTDLAFLLGAVHGAGFTFMFFWLGSSVLTATLLAMGAVATGVVIVTALWPRCST